MAPRGMVAGPTPGLPFSSLRKLEWNCKGEERDLWKHVMQFRPSGLRVKRMSTVPALVALTTTQIPVIGPRHRLDNPGRRVEAQGFPDHHRLPESRVGSFRALGNAVHAQLDEYCQDGSCQQGPRETADIPYC